MEQKKTELNRKTIFKKISKMRKAVRFSMKSSLSPKQLFFLSKAQISNSTFVFGNMYSLHFAHYLRLETACKKGALSLDEEYNLLEEKLKETSRNFLNVTTPVERRDSTRDRTGSQNSDNNSATSDCSENSNSADSAYQSNGSDSRPNSPRISVNNNGFTTPKKVQNGNNSNNPDDRKLSRTDSQTSDLSTTNSENSSTPSDPMHKAPSSPVPHKNSIAVCLAPGLPYLLQNFQKSTAQELKDKILHHLNRLDAVCREYNKMLIVIGYLPVYKGTFLKKEEANKINEILMTLDTAFSTHQMFDNKFVKYFQISKVLKTPEMRKCGIYPTSNSYLIIGEKLQEYIYGLSDF